ncbi:DM13 domain-containing protein [Patescibacteria group bacterium]|nr:DM13 domain-containing protein [Patescibacteria group bacterium]MBU2259930.1 DM13 domain-containing protein [Patescibacteria group bacterium]
MKRLLTLAALSLLITACSPRNTSTMTLAERLQNPLFAERYSKMLVGRLTELEIDKDPLLEDPKMQELVTSTKTKWMEVDREARRIQREGMKGEFVGIKEYALGEVLLLEHMLYFASDFETDPGPGLSIFLSDAIDPREVDGFPRTEEINLGPLQSPYGQQRYTIPETVDTTVFRTVILWDTELQRLYGFAQISK